MTKNLGQSYLINADLEEVWKGLVDERYIDDWGGGPAKMNGNVGTKFTLWGGNIHGKNLEVIPNQKLVQEWIGDDGNAWIVPSIVTFTLFQEEAGVRVNLDQVNIPQKSFKGIAKGWKEFYLGPMKEYLEEDLTPIRSRQSR